MSSDFLRSASSNVLVRAAAPAVIISLSRGIMCRRQGRGKRAAKMNRTKHTKTLKNSYCRCLAWKPCLRHLLPAFQHRYYVFWPCLMWLIPERKHEETWKYSGQGQAAADGLLTAATLHDAPEQTESDRGTFAQKSRCSSCAGGRRQHPSDTPRAAPAHVPAPRDLQRDICSPGPRASLRLGRPVLPSSACCLLVVAPPPMPRSQATTGRLRYCYCHQEPRH